MKIIGLIVGIIVLIPLILLTLTLPLLFGSFPDASPNLFIFGLPFADMFVAILYKKIFGNYVPKFIVWLDKTVLILGIIALILVVSEVIFVIIMQYNAGL